MQFNEITTPQRPTRWEQAHAETARVDAERSGARRDIERVFMLLGTGLGTTAHEPLLPYADLLTGLEKRQSIAEVVLELLPEDKALAMLLALLDTRADRLAGVRANLLADMAEAYAEKYAADVGNARAGSWA